MSVLWQARFFTTVNRLGDLPKYNVPEIAFAGRSNAGKSTAINLLCNQKKLAFASKTPGRTQHINFFSLGGAHVGQHHKDETRVEEINAFLVDLPGYGYAAVGKEKVASWSKLMRDYLRGRAQLARVFVLVDARRGIKPVDGEMFDLLDQAAVSYQVILTKRDCVKVADQAARVRATEEGLAKRAAAYPEVLFTSSESGEGIEDLRAAIVRLMAERGQ